MHVKLVHDGISGYSVLPLSFAQAGSCASHANPFYGFFINKYPATKRGLQEAY